MKKGFKNSNVTFTTGMAIMGVLILLICYLGNVDPNENRNIVWLIIAIIVATVAMLYSLDTWIFQVKQEETQEKRNKAKAEKVAKAEKEADAILEELLRPILIKEIIENLTNREREVPLTEEQLQELHSDIEWFSIEELEEIVNSRGTTW